MWVQCTRVCGCVCKGVGAADMQTCHVQTCKGVAGARDSPIWALLTQVPIYVRVIRVRVRVRVTCFTPYRGFRDR